MLDPEEKKILKKGKKNKTCTSMKDLTQIVIQYGFMISVHEHVIKLNFFGSHDKNRK